MKQCLLSLLRINIYNLMKKFLFSMKGILLFVVCVFCTVSAAAQEEGGKPNVFIDYFTRPSSVPFLWTENLRSCVIEGIIATGRVELIDVDSKDALNIEKERRESGETVAGNDMDRLKVMTNEGANYLIQGTVTSISTDISKLKDGTTYYTATCAYTLKVINPNDGKLVSTKTFKHGDGITNGVTADTEEEAVSKVCRQAVKAMRELVEAAFKVQGTILEISAEKKGEAKEVYISIGSDHGVGEGAYFSACIERKVAGRTSQKEIGQLKVKNVEGGDITLCEVKKGGEEIKKAIDAGQTVVVKSMKKTSIWDKAGNAVNSL